MALTDENLLLERQHLSGVQRLYRFKNGAGLSLVNASILHSYPFEWEAAVLKGVTPEGAFKGLDYSTPLTGDVEVFQSEKEANEFIAKAAALFASEAYAGNKEGGE